MNHPVRLIADIGGSNLRFAVVDRAGRIDHLWIRSGTEFSSFDEALAAYLDTLGREVTIVTAVIAAAGPVLNCKIVLTNRSWTISAEALRARLGPDVNVHLLNDLEAVAHALPHLTEDDLVFIDQRPAPLEARNRMLVVNVGTGFGSACLIRSPSGWISCPSESGHMFLGAISQDELDFFGAASTKAPTYEDFLSGPGVRLIASVFAGSSDPAQRALDFNLADDGPAAKQTIERMTVLMARACRNLTLASAAWDGLYLCGSVAKAWWQQADLKAFRRRFAAHSKMQMLLESTPACLLSVSDPALIGLANFPPSNITIS